MREFSAAEQSVLRAIYFLAKANGSVSSTGKIKRGQVSRSANVSESSIGRLLQRSRDKGGLARQAYKKGNCGWVIYRLADSLFDEFSRLESVGLIKTQTQTQTRTNPPPVVVVKNTENKNNNTLQIPESLSRLGLTEAALQGSKLTHEKLQESLYSFAFDLEAGRVKPKTTILGLLIGVVVKRSVPYTSDVYIKQQDKEISEIENRSASAAATQVEMAALIAFENWSKTAPKEQKLEMQPESGAAPFGSKIYERALKATFLQRHQTHEDGHR